MSFKIGGYECDHPEWADDDEKFVRSLIKHKKYYEEMYEKYSFNHPIRIQIRVILINLDNLIERLKKEYAETYC